MKYLGAFMILIGHVFFIVLIINVVEYFQVKKNYYQIEGIVSYADSHIVTYEFRFNNIKRKSTTFINGSGLRNGLNVKIFVDKKTGKDILGYTYTYMIKYYLLISLVLISLGFILYRYNYKIKKLINDGILGYSDSV